MKVLLFDIDGTLIRAGKAARTAFDKAFEDVFGAKNAWQNTSAHGNTDLRIFQEIAERILQRRLDAPEYKSLCSSYLKQLEHELEQANGYRVLPGIVSLCEELQQRSDIALGLETGNIEQGARLKLRRGGLDHFFLFGGFGSDSEERTEIIKIAVERSKQFTKRGHYEPKEVIVIGDAPQDIQAGKTLGYTTVGVATGLSSTSELSDYHPDLLFEDLSEWGELLSKLEI